jgi:hypothetical protein
VTDSGGRPNSNTLGSVEARWVSGRERQHRFHVHPLASRYCQKGRRNTYLVTLTDFPGAFQCRCDRKKR